MSKRYTTVRPSTAKQMLFAPTPLVVFRAPVNVVGKVMGFTVVTLMSVLIALFVESTSFVGILQVTIHVTVKKDGRSVILQTLSAMMWMNASWD